MGEGFGKIKEAVGWATGDREVEAEGRVEQQVAGQGDAPDEVSEPAVALETEAIREEYGERQPDATDGSDGSG